MGIRNGINLTFRGAAKSFEEKNPYDKPLCTFLTIQVKPWKLDKFKILKFELFIQDSKWIAMGKKLRSVTPKRNRPQNRRLRVCYIGSGKRNNDQQRVRQTCFDRVTVKLNFGKSVVNEKFFMFLRIFSFESVGKFFLQPKKNFSPFVSQKFIFDCMWKFNFPLTATDEFRFE